jgi:hypothetical protein
MSPHESAAMWKIYTITKESIAIRSTFAKLRDRLDENCFIGTVKYIDYETDFFPHGNVLYPFVHKRKSFAYENEIRALTHVLPWDEIHKSASQDTTQWRISDSPIQPPDGI